MVEQVMHHIKKDRREKEYYALMHVLSHYLYSMRGLKQTVKTHMYIGTGKRGLKKYGCSRFKVDCVQLDEEGNIKFVYEILKREKLTPSYQKRFNLKKRMLSEIYDRHLFTETYSEIDRGFESWLFHELENYQCANDAYQRIIDIIDDATYQCRPSE
jgi:hypothetical protein